MLAEERMNTCRIECLQAGEENEEGFNGNGQR